MSARHHDDAKQLLRQLKDSLAEFDKVLGGEEYPETREAVDGMMFEVCHLDTLTNDQITRVRNGNADAATLRSEPASAQVDDMRAAYINHPLFSDFGKLAQRPAGAGDDDIEVAEEAVETRCPFSGEDMRVVVVNTACGHAYSEGGVRQALQGRRSIKCPMQGCAHLVSARSFAVDSTRTRRVLLALEKARKDRAAKHVEVIDDL